MSEEFRVPRNARGQRLDQVLAGQLPDMSRRRARLLIDQGSVYVDGHRCKVASKPAQTGAIIRVETRERFASAKDIPILAEGDDWVVVNKPAGWPTVPTLQASKGSVADALRHQLQREVFPIHRLDIETTGVLLFAYTQPTALAFSEEFKTSRAERRYLALVHGQPPEDAFDINAPIAPADRGYQRIATDGRPSLTRVWVRARGAELSLLECQAVTGRTHQLRLHLAHVGHPLVGDRRYGLANASAAPCFGLHAWKLALRDPTQSLLKFEARPSQVWDDLKIRAKMAAVVNPTPPTKI